MFSDILELHLSWILFFCLWSGTYFIKTNLLLCILFGTLQSACQAAATHCKENGKSISKLAMQYSLLNKEITSVLVGMKSVEQVLFRNLPELPYLIVYIDISIFWKSMIWRIMHETLLKTFCISVLFGQSNRYLSLCIVWSIYEHFPLENMYIFSFCHFHTYQLNKEPSWRKEC